jgi:hypothetical protein
MEGVVAHLSIASQILRGRWRPVTLRRSKSSARRLAHEFAERPALLGAPRGSGGCAASEVVGAERMAQRRPTHLAPVRFEAVLAQQFLRARIGQHRPRGNLPQQVIQLQLRARVAVVRQPLEQRIGVAVDGEVDRIAGVVYNAVKLPKALGWKLDCGNTPSMGSSCASERATVHPTLVRKPAAARNRQPIEKIFLCLENPLLRHES